MPRSFTEALVPQSPSASRFNPEASRRTAFPKERAHLGPELRRLVVGARGSEFRESFRISMSNIVSLARAAGCHPRSVRYWENKGSNPPI